MVAVRKDRDDLIDQREVARAQAASVLRNSSGPAEGDLDQVQVRPPRRHRFGHRAALAEGAVTTPQITDPQGDLGGSSAK
jgi:hypothetical protein